MSRMSQRNSLGLFSKFPALIGLIGLLAVLTIATKLVQTNQDLRSRATTGSSSIFGCPYQATFGVGTLSHPSDVYVDGYPQNLYISDSGNHKVFKYDNFGNLVVSWGGSGTGNGLFQNGPTSITAHTEDGTEYMYALDGNTPTAPGRVEKFTTGGVFVSNVLSGSYSDLTFDVSGNMYAANTATNQIEKYSRSGSTWTKIFSWGSTGSGGGQMNHPVSLATSQLGNIIVSDMNNYRLERFGNNGVYIPPTVGSLGAGPGQFGTSGPQGLIAVPNNSTGTTSFLVADTTNNRLELFSEALTFIAADGFYGTGNGQFSAPTSVSYYSTYHTIYVSDAGNSRVQSFWCSDTPPVLNASPTPTPNPSPNPSPNAVVLNSRSGQSCNTLCAGIGKTCSKIGDDTNGTNLKYWTNPTGTCVEVTTVDSTSACALTMTNWSPKKNCDQHNVWWTNCDCQ